MQWDTVSAELSKCMSDLPMALDNYVSDFKSIDLITPNCKETTRETQLFRTKRCLR